MLNKHETCFYYAWDLLPNSNQYFVICLHLLVAKKFTLSVNDQHLQIYQRFIKNIDLFSCESVSSHCRFTNAVSLHL